MVFWSIQYLLLVRISFFTKNKVKHVLGQLNRIRLTKHFGIQMIDSDISTERFRIEKKEVS